MRYDGEVVRQERDVKIEQMIRPRLDALIAKEKEYEPGAAVPLLRKRNTFAFRREIEESLDLHSRHRMCPALEHDLGPSVDERVRMLFILGTQRGGTEYLFNALIQHRGFVGADQSYG